MELGVCNECDDRQGGRESMSDTFRSLWEHLPPQELGVQLWTLLALSHGHVFGTWWTGPTLQSTLSFISCYSSTSIGPQSTVNNPNKVVFRE